MGVDERCLEVISTVAASVAPSTPTNGSRGTSCGTPSSDQMLISPVPDSSRDSPSDAGSSPCKSLSGVLDDACASECGDSQVPPPPASLVMVADLESTVDDAASDALEDSLAAACGFPSDIVPLDSADVPTAEKAEDILPSDLADVPMAIIALNMLLSLPANIKSILKQRLQGVHRLLADGCSAGFLVATACSGTDLIIPTMSIFFRLVALTLGMPESIQLEHAWSCEWTPWKAEWIRDVMGASTIFKDVTHLGKQRAATHGADALEFVCSSLLFATGFSCKSVSAYNQFRSTFHDAIRKKKGSTGQSFWGAFSHIKKTLPLWVWFENVKMFSGRNLAMVLKLLRLAGYIVVTLVLDLESHGTRCRRSRVWILAKLSPLATVAMQEQAQQRADDLEKMLRQSPQPLPLFVDVDNTAQWKCKGARAKAAAKPKAKAAVKPKAKADAKPKSSRTSAKRSWQDLHEEVWAEIEDGMPAPLPAKFRKLANELEAHLTPRECDVAVYDFVTNKEEYENMGPEDMRFLDVSQTICRTPSGWNVCPLISPGARTIVVKHDKARLLHPFESLQFQGFSHKMLTKKGAESTSKFAGRQLQNLAGNALCSNHVCVAAVLSLIVFDFPETIADLEILRAQASNLIVNRNLFRNQIHKFINRK